MVTCHACHAETEPYAEMGSDDPNELQAGTGGIVFKCANCKAPIRDAAEPASSALPRRSTGGASPPPEAARLVIERRGHGRDFGNSEAPSPDPPDADALYRSACARLQTVRARLAEMAKLQDEAARLELMLQALAPEDNER